MTSGPRENNRCIRERVQCGLRGEGENETQDFGVTGLRRDSNRAKAGAMEPRLPTQHEMSSELFRDVLCVPKNGVDIQIV